MERRSEKRDALLENLRRRCDHPTAEAVYAGMKKIYPTISLGTVYRNLGQLADSGKIIKVGSPDGKEHYDGRTEPHTHFYCERCERVFDVSVRIDAEKAEKELGAVINHASCTLRGICRACLEKENTK